MERRFRIRLDELLDDAEVPTGLLRGVLPRLESFLQPFIAILPTPEQQTNTRHYLQGLLSDLPGKDVESIAYWHDRERQGLQKFIGQAEWDHQPLLSELVRQVATELGEADGVLVFNPSAFPKKGTESVGVQRHGAAGSARSTTVRWVSTSATSRAANMPWSISGSTFPRSGPSASGGVRRPACQPRFGSARGTN